jgi:phospholipase C
LPYELNVSGTLNEKRDRIVLRFEAGKEQFGQRAAGSPFIVYARKTPDTLEVRDYAVAAGTHLEDSWPIADFENGAYHLCVYGPNGFFREFRGTTSSPRLEVRIQPVRPNATDSSPGSDVQVQVINHDANPVDVEIVKRSYGKATHRQEVAPQKTVAPVVEAEQSFGWYDFVIRVADDKLFQQTFAGRIETGKWSFSDPLIGRDST